MPVILTHAALGNRCTSPMLLNERTDVLTAMGTSAALVWNNLLVILTWGAIVVVLFIPGLASGLIGLVIVFPALGHATWHAYRAVRQQTSAVELNRISEIEGGYNRATP